MGPSGMNAGGPFAPPSGLGAKLGSDGALASSAFSLMSSPFAGLDEASLRQRLSGQPPAPPWGGSVQEVTARLLFMVIRWVKCLPTFQTLSKGDQASAAGKSQTWRERCFLPATIFFCFIMLH